MQDMYYFTNENIFTFNSGTEFSAMNRQRLFKHFKVNSKILTRNYNQELHQEIKRNGMDNNDVINMYDYFQHTINVPNHHEKLRYSKMIDKYNYKIKGINNNKSLILYRGNVVAKVYIAPATVGEIGTVEYYDRFGNVTSKDIWDSRGFKSKTQYMHPDGRIGHELVYDYSGHPVIEITHMNINHKLFPTMFKLLNYHGHDWRFNTENELFSFFLEEILRIHPGVLINDRPTLTAPVANVNDDIKRYQFLHNVQTMNAGLAGSKRGKLFPVLNSFFHHYIKKFDGLIVSTEDQKHDLERLFPIIPVHTIFDTALFKNDKIDTNPKKTKNNKLVYIGRISPDKNIFQMLQVVNLVRNKISNVKLQIVGYYSSNKFQKDLNKEIKKLKLEKVVQFYDYMIGKPKRQILNHSQVMLQTSLGEGLGMSLVEGLQYGLPEVAYDINYGPNHIIENNVNGYIVDPGNVSEAANCVIAILSNPHLYKHLSQNAFKMASRFSVEQVMKQWQNLDD